jgi:replicative DNA helicase
MIKLSDKLEKVNDHFEVHMYDNGFMFEIGGRNQAEDWISAKIICTNINELVELIKEASALPRD